MSGVYVNKVNGKFQVGTDGNHRVVAARVLNLSRIRVRVEVPDYELAIVKYSAIRLREKWYVSSSVNFERGVVDISFPLPAFPEMPARLEALGFTFHIIS
ncbi:hypothetical protein [Pseudodesulfovibrio pelocollis]|uniref:hypothetical protein n=1 Tax=Pseudodesulfovibrio pelocollis TaxID=3051432 RepID=UPI00255AB0C6|nr:hypothetical protein [Pseudodesulfovibrio sp. SB368]